MRSLVILFGIAGLLTGCTHPLEIKNLKSYQPTKTVMAKDLWIGVYTINTLADGEPIVAGTANGLRDIAKDVLYPCPPANHPEHIDVISNITVRFIPKGSGNNFWINFPGFLVWAPAWNGYIYKPSYEIFVHLTDAKDNSTIDEFTIPVKLDVRHADISRTWAELSWLEVGIMAFVSGFVYMGYDDDITPQIDRMAQKPIGDYVAHKIVERINNSNYQKKAPVTEEEHTILLNIPSRTLKN